MHISAMECLVYAKSFQNLQKKSIYVDLDMSYDKSSKLWKKFRDRIPTLLQAFTRFGITHVQDEIDAIFLQILEALSVG